MPQQKDGYGNLVANAPDLSNATISTVAIGVASVQSAAFQSTTKFITLSCSAACWVIIGSNPTAVKAAAGNFFLPASVTPSTYYVPAGQKLAVIEDSATGNLSVTEWY